MKQTRYLIDTLVVSDGSVGPVRLQMAWPFSSCYEDEAESYFASLELDRKVVAAALTRWESDAAEPLQHGSWAVRSCAPSVRQVVMKHADRSWAATCVGERYITLDDWQVEAHPTLVYGGPGAGFRLTPRKISERQRLLMAGLRTFPVNEGMYLATWKSLRTAQELGHPAISSQVISALRLIVLQNDPDVVELTHERITYTLEDRRIMALINRSLTIPAGMDERPAVNL